MSAQRKGREGSRWYNERPSSDEVAKWFVDTVQVADGLDAVNYVSGITLINSTEKTKETTGFRENGTPINVEAHNVVYTPYPRVDTRIKYFHDLMTANPDWYGVIEPVAVENPHGVNLPVGFFPFRVKAEGGETTFICCSMKVTVWKREGYEEKVYRNPRTGEESLVRTGSKIIDAPPATKMIATSRKYPDENALMKAETGAVGRALGMAGMLVVPGAGVATAEDLQELPVQEARPASPEPPEPKLPVNPPEADDEALRVRALELIELLKETSPDGYKSFETWAKERSLGQLSECHGPALKGVVRQLERKLDQIEKAAPSDSE